MTKKLGVIGGMGPEASVFFYDEVTAHTKAGKDQDHIDMVIISHASMPDRTQAILTGREEELLAAMEQDLKLMETAGVANIAITCNTSHYFYDKLQLMTRIPIINMPQEAVLLAGQRFGTVRRRAGGNDPDHGFSDHLQKTLRLGIMATDGTIRTGLYHKACRRCGYEPVAPSATAQEDVMSLIYDDIKAGVAHPDTQKFTRAYEDLKAQGCDGVILACTELSVYRSRYAVPGDCVDAMDSLVRQAILRSGAEYI